MKGLVKKTALQRPHQMVPMEASMGYDDDSSDSDASRDLQLPESGLSLSRLRLTRMQRDIDAAKMALEDARNIRAFKAELRKEEIAAERAEIAHRLELKQRLDARIKAVTSIQAWCRGRRIRQRLLPRVRSESEWAKLLDSRSELKKSLLGLRHTVHGLTYLSEHKAKAAAVLQRWWRGVLEKRVQRILDLRAALERMYEKLTAAATAVQAAQRGAASRALCQRLRREREERQRKARRDREAKRTGAAIRIQAWVRRIFAAVETAKRREEMAVALRAGDGLTMETRRSILRRDSTFSSATLHQRASVDRSSGRSSTVGLGYATPTSPAKQRQSLKNKQAPTKSARPSAKA